MDLTGKLAFAGKSGGSGDVGFIKKDLVETELQNEVTVRMAHRLT